MNTDNYKFPSFNNNVEITRLSNQSFSYRRCYVYVYHVYIEVKDNIQITNISSSIFKDSSFLVKSRCNHAVKLCAADCVFLFCFTNHFTLTEFFFSRIECSCQDVFLTVNR